MTSERVIKLMGALDTKKNYKADRYDIVLKDMTEEFDRYGKVKSLCIIRPKEKKLGGKNYLFTN